VLIITADDLGLELGAYGSDLVPTPNIDRFAESATVFDLAWVTESSCSASRSSLFTGLFPHSNGQVGLAGAGAAMHDAALPLLLPVQLEAAGYQTGLIGKLHVAPREAFGWDYMPERVPREVVGMAGLAATYWDEAGTAPWMLVVSYADPHASFGQECRDCGFPPQVEGLPEVPIEPSARTILPFQGVDSPDQRIRTANYLNSVSRLDTGIGLLFEELERRELSERTLVIFLSDHGPPFDRAKTTTYEAGLRVPFMLRWPGVSTPGRTSAPVSTIDIVPTVLDALGLAIPRLVQGRSLRPVLTGDDDEWRTYLFAGFHAHSRGQYYPRRAVRGDRYKLIHNLMSGRARPLTGIDGDRGLRAARKRTYRNPEIETAFETFADPPEFELYDLESDPFERVNLADDEAYGEVLGDLLSTLRQWRVDTSDPLLEPAAVAQMEARFRAPPRNPLRWSRVRWLVWAVSLWLLLGAFRRIRQSRETSSPSAS
jgi:N-sulfoglucosamine sulfohydrolase